MYMKIVYDENLKSNWIIITLKSLKIIPVKYICLQAWIVTLTVEDCNQSDLNTSEECNQQKYYLIFMGKSIQNKINIKSNN